MIPSLVSQSAASKSFKILTHQLHTSLISYHTRSWAHFPRSRPQAWRIFQRMWGRWGWCRWGDKGGKSRSGGGGWVWCKPASNNDFLTLLAACWTAAFKHKSRQRLISGEFHSRVFKTKDTHKFQGKQFSSCSAPDWYQVINGFPRKVQGPKSWMQSLPRHFFETSDYSACWVCPKIINNMGNLLEPEKSIWRDSQPAKFLNSTIALRMLAFIVTSKL